MGLSSRMACCDGCRGLAGGADSGVRANVSADNALRTLVGWDPRRYRRLEAAGRGGTSCRNHFLAAGAWSVGRDHRGEAVEIGRARTISATFASGQPSLIRSTGGQELDHLAQPEHRLASLALGRREHAHLHVVPHEAFVG